MPSPAERILRKLHELEALLDCEPESLLLASYRELYWACVESLPIGIGYRVLERAADKLEGR